MIFVRPKYRHHVLFLIFGEFNCSAPYPDTITRATHANISALEGEEEEDEEEPFLCGKRLAVGAAVHYSSQRDLLSLTNGVDK